MRFFYQLPLRFRSLFRRTGVEQELSEELRFHLENQIDEKIAEGMTPEEARCAALRELGGVEQIKEECRDMRRVNFIENLIQDLRYAFRVLAKSPGFAAVVILSLALGIGANTAIFSLIDAVMLKMLPVERPAELVLLSWASQSRFGTVPWFAHSLSGNSDQDSTGRFTSTAFSYPIFDDIRAHTQAFSGVLAFSDPDPLNVGVGGQADLATGEYVSGDYFSTLGVPAALGRTITPADDKVGASPAATISYRYWTTRFGRDPLAVGKAITVNAVPFTVVGVAAPEFFGVQPGASIDIWIPLRTQPQVEPGWTAYATPGEVSRFTAHDDWWVLIMGRLKPGVSQRQARAALDLVLRRDVAAIEPPPPAKRSPDTAFEPPQVQLTSASKGLDSLRQEFSQPLFILMAVVGLVLLIACANVANLLLSRASTRQKEIAVRLALGAGRRRLIRQLLTESVLLATAGGVLGVALAYWASDVLLAFMSGGRNPVILHVVPSLRVLGFTAAVSVLTGILFGLAPALRGTRLDLTPALKEGAGKIVGRAGQSRGLHLGLGKLLVVAQVAMSLVLLLGAGLFVRTLTNLENENVGFDRHNLLLFGIAPAQAGYKGERLGSLYDELRRRIAAIPGVQSASLSRHTFIDGGVTIDGISIQGYTPKPGESENGSVSLHVNSVGPEFFETYGIPLALGRTIADRDTASAAKVAVVNRAFADRYLAGTNPIGRRFGFGDPKASSEIAIVGVVGDVKYGQLRDAAPPTVYVPYAQESELPEGMNFEVRTAGDPRNWIGAVRRTVQGLDRNLPLWDVKTQTEQIDQATFQERLFARLAGFFGLLALVLACVGLYGMMSYAVARRTNEIGIRMALGAERAKILRMVLRESMTLAVLGIIFGGPAALAGSRLIASMLYGVKPTDPLTIASATGALAAVALLAGYLPAQRASRVDPMVALRYE
ncbi:MAG TPA: ABC transporter permease [Terriglobia bacterium]|nr:ABC transporter permease [Terriglobia bacterium]